MTDKKPDTQFKRKYRGIGRRILFGILLVFVIAIAAFFGYTGATPANALRFLGIATDIFNTKVTSVMTGKSVPPFKGQQHVNILLLGVDVSTDPSGSDCRTDTIKFISADFAKSTISVMSIPRDTWVEIPQHGHQRINNAYPLGGRSEANRVASSKSVISTTVERSLRAAGAYRPGDAPANRRVRSHHRCHGRHRYRCGKANGL